MNPIVALQLRQMLGGKRILLLAGVLALPVLLTLIISSSEGGVSRNRPEQGVLVYLISIFTQIITLLLACFHGTSVLGTEIEGKTLTYLFARPVPRWQVVLFKYAAVAVSLVIPLVACLVACWVMLGSIGGGRLILGVTVATAAAALVYVAVFTLVGILFPRRALLVGLLLAGLWEFTVAWIPTNLGAMTAIRHLRVIAFEASGYAAPKHYAPYLGGESLTTAIVALIAITAGALSLAAWVVSRKEYVLTEAA